MGTLHEYLEQLKKKVTGSVLGTGTFQGQDYAIVSAERIVDICRFFKEELGFDFLTDVTAAHYPDEEYQFEIIYHLYSFSTNERARLKTRLKEGEEALTVTSVWRSANWNEREAYDMFGIVFKGHPDLRRILMPEEYDEFPLRKDFPMKGR